MMLGKNFPFEMQGRLAEAIELCETALEAARLSASPHELYRALFELGVDALLRGRPRRRDRGVRGERRASIRGSPAARSRTAGGGPGLGARRRAGSRPARSSAARTILLELGGEDVARTMPVERCFDWESLALVELAAGNAEAAERLRAPRRGGRGAARR